MEKILIELFNHNNKNDFNMNIKKLNIYIKPNIICACIEQNYCQNNLGIDGNKYLLDGLLYDAMNARNSYNVSLLLSNRLSKCIDNKYWLPSEIWNIITNNLKIELVNKIKTYKINIPRTLTIKNNVTIGNYDYAITYKFNENGSIDKDIKLII